VGGAISKVESARVVLAPNGMVLLRGGSGLSNPLYLFLSRKWNITTWYLPSWVQDIYVFGPSL